MKQRILRKPIEYVKCFKNAEILTYKSKKIIYISLGNRDEMQANFFKTMNYHNDVLQIVEHFTVFLVRIKYNVISFNITL
jgi:hypothetical protein